jgi:hypothetical protein
LNVPLENEMHYTLETLGIELMNAKHPLDAELHRKCSGLRDDLLEKEAFGNRRFILEDNFWNITSKYRLDILLLDIPRIANELAFAIGFSTSYLEHIAVTNECAFPSFGDSFFWYHIDFGVRLVSSGWDRLALLLHIAFGLQNGERCNLGKVLKEIPRLYPEIVRNKDFKAIKQFHDEKLKELEDGPGRGVRHETTHIFSPSTRFFCEFVEKHVIDRNDRLTHIKWRDQLVEHHSLYILGISQVLGMVASQWPPRY